MIHKGNTEQTWKSSAQPLYAKVSLNKPGWNAKNGWPNALNLIKKAEITYTSTPENISELWLMGRTWPPYRKSM